MFSGRFSSYGRPDSSDDEEEVSSGFRLNRGEGSGAAAAVAGGAAGAGPVTAGNIALAAALDNDDDSATGKIVLETENDGEDI